MRQVTASRCEPAYLRACVPACDCKCSCAWKRTRAGDGSGKGQKIGRKGSGALGNTAGSTDTDYGYEYLRRTRVKNHG